jgi:DNA-binding NarL/FixJ family response regulator
MKILVVDDHSLITDALSVLFLDLDPSAEVLTTRTAEGAMQMLEQEPDLDLVVLDLGLPGVSGTSLLEAMVGHSPELKILVLSGNQDQRNVMRVLQLGAAGFVPKSMASDTLLSAVKFVLSGGVYIPADLLEEVNRAGLLSSERSREGDSSRVELTERQEQVLQLLARGAPIKIICRELGLSEGTVKTHVTAIYRAFGASNRTEALLAARRHGYDIG